MTEPYCLTYLATPYSHADPAVMEQRFRTACEIAGDLMAAGQVVFSPIAHCHPIAVRRELPRSWEFWEKYDRTFLAAADRVVVAMMPGWEKSTGVQAEIQLAREMGKPITFLRVQRGTESGTGAEPEKPPLQPARDVEVTGPKFTPQL